jgi:hypothetical protein
MKPNTSRRLITSIPSSGSFSRRRVGQQGQTRWGSVPFSQRKRLSTANHQILNQFIIILCLLLVILTDNIKSKSDFNFVFEEMGLMFSSTDYQLATMKVNLKLLKNTLFAFKDTVIKQRKFIQEIPRPLYQKTKLVIPEQFKNRNKENYWLILDHTLKRLKLLGLQSPTNQGSPTSNETSRHQ